MTESSLSVCSEQHMISTFMHWLVRLSAPVHGAALALAVAADQLVKVEDEGRRAGAEVQLHLLVLAAGSEAFTLSSL